MAYKTVNINYKVPQANEENFVIARCNNCNDIACEPEGTGLCEDIEDAKEFAESERWIVLENDIHYCPDCIEEFHERINPSN